MWVGCLPIKFPKAASGRWVWSQGCCRFGLTLSPVSGLYSLLLSRSYDPRCQGPGPTDSCPSLVAMAFPPGVVLWVRLCCSERYIELLTLSPLECGSIWQWLVQASLAKLRSYWSRAHGHGKTEMETLGSEARRSKEDSFPRGFGGSVAGGHLDFGLLTFSPVWQ